MAARTATGRALDAADGVVDGKFFGAQIYEKGTSSAAAQALDAADGVVDGRFQGRAIYEAAGSGAAGGGVQYTSSRSYGNYANAGATTSVSAPSGGAAGVARALDAADGAIDGSKATCVHVPMCHYFFLEYSRRSGFFGLFYHFFSHPIHISLPRMIFRLCVFRRNAINLHGTNASRTSCHCHTGTPSDVLSLYADFFS